METAVFENLRKALESLTIEDDEYILVRHILEAGERIKPHYHPNATEWVIVNSGVVVESLEGENKLFNSSDILANDEMVFLFPKGKIHALEALTKTEYFVLRDKKDKTIYTKRERNKR